MSFLLSSGTVLMAPGSRVYCLTFSNPNSQSIHSHSDSLWFNQARLKILKGLSPKSLGRNEREPNPGNKRQLELPQISRFQTLTTANLPFPDPGVCPEITSWLLASRPPAAPEQGEIWTWLHRISERSGKGLRLPLREGTALLVFISPAPSSRPGTRTDRWKEGREWAWGQYQASKVPS